LTLAALVLALVWGLPPAVAHATDPAPWTSLLPAAPGGRGPDEAAECPGGDPKCVQQVEAALTREVTDLRCDHNAVFARAYLLITRDVAVASQTPGFFADPAYINHFDAAFAAEYGRQWDAYRAGAPTAPAWRIAFDAADGERVSGPGDLYLAINAHIGRDMPLILARVGLDALRRADQNKVNDVLYAGMRPLLNELAANYDPSLGFDLPGTVDDLALYQYIAALRERAWRLAEELAAAPSDPVRAAITARIEAEAASSAVALRTTFAYPPIGRPAALRDAYCAAHWTPPS
jgi:Family of unknown function (DUF5995)